MRDYRAVLRAAVSVGLTALACALYARAAWPWVVLGWVGLVPWLAALDRVRAYSGALALGIAMAIAFELAVFGWFAGTIADYADAPRWAMSVLLALAAPLLQPQLVTVALARHAARRHGLDGGADVIAAVTWVGTEWATGKLFADTFGWGLYGSLWMRQAADLAGTGGLTLVLVVANGRALAVARALAGGGAPAVRGRGAVRPALATALLAAALLAYGALRCRALTAVPAAPPLTAAIVQGDISHYDRLAARIGTYAAVRTILDAHFALSEEALAAGGVELLVWPETVYPTTFGAPKSADGAAFDREIAAFVARHEVPLVFGSYDRDAAREFNAAFFLTPSKAAEMLAGPAGSVALPAYRKHWLFPLTEHVPAWLDRAWLRRHLPWLGTWHPGPGAAAVPLALADGRVLRVAPLICYDALAHVHALAEVRAGAELFITLSNDAWLVDGPGARMHLLGSAFRSIESRRPQLRATPTGISAAIDPAGTIVAQAGIHERRALIATIVPGAGLDTLRLRWGEWLGPSALALAAALLLGVAVRRRPRHGPTGGGRRLTSGNP